MPSHHLEAIDRARLLAATGAGAWDRVTDTWQGVRNFTGGATAGLVHGPNASERAVDRWADTSSQATKAGFELGAMGNMAMGPVGGLVATAAGSVPTGSGK